MDSTLLERTPIYGGLNRQTVDYIVTHAATIAVPARGYFFHEGDAADAMYVLTAGRVAVTRRYQSAEYILAFLHEGDCFGEMALLDFSNRSASVRAETDCTALRIDLGMLQDLYRIDHEQYTLIQMNLGREISRRLREADQTSFEQAILTHRFIHGEFSLRTT